MVTRTGGGSDPEKLKSEARDGYRVDDKQRQLIGYIGALLPLILIVMAMARDGVDRWRSLSSISAYYYSGAVSAFVGMLVSLAVFLFTYRPYKNKKFSQADRWVACTAAVAALGVALFPTEAPKDVPALPWWTQATGVLHYVCAVVLFLMFAVFALWLFRLKPAGKTMPPDKRWRNRVYLTCGIVIVVCMIWAGIAGLRHKPIFWPETFALIAFSVSWLFKGYALRPIADTLRSFGS
jgi:NADH:ubiquinone oxidoreductase subunit 6 (subunit J)